MVNATRRPGRPKQADRNVPTSDRILKVAGQLFLDKGFDSVSTDEVAQATGITKAMIYYYFSSKAELFTASMVRIMENRIDTRSLDISPVF